MRACPLSLRMRSFSYKRFQSSGPGVCPPAFALISPGRPCCFYRTTDLVMNIRAVCRCAELRIALDIHNDTLGSSDVQIVEAFALAVHNLQLRIEGVVYRIAQLGSSVYSGRGARRPFLRSLSLRSQRPRALSLDPSISTGVS